MNHAFRISIYLSLIHISLSEYRAEAHAAGEGGKEERAVHDGENAGGDWRGSQMCIRDRSKDDHVFPVPSNGRCNTILKELGRQADVGLGVCLATAGDDPEVAVEEGLEPVGRQRLHVRVCQSGEHGEDEEVAYQFAGPAFHRGLHQCLYLTLRQVASVNALGGIDVPGEGVEGKRTAVAGDGDDVLEPDHVTPYGIGAAFLLRTQEILEVVDERQVEFL